MATTNPKPAEPTPPPSSSGSVPQSYVAQPTASSMDPTPPASLSVPGHRPSASVDTTDWSPSHDATSPPFSPSSTTPVLGKSDEEHEDEPELDFTGNVDVNDNLPTEQDLVNVGDLLLLDSQGQSRPFKELYRGAGVAPRQLVIFIRHFFCGNCQEYLRTLSSSITPEALLALPTPTFITVIGCGRPELIDMYAQTTGCPFPIYAEPTRKIYDLLGMTRTFDLGKKRPNYIQTNLIISSVQSIMQGIKTGNKALKGGDFKQVGGEFLFEDGKCVWVHRMRNTRDHCEVEELRGLLGLSDARPPLRKRWSHGIKEAKGRDRSLSWGKARLRSKSRTKRDGSVTPEEKDEDLMLNNRGTI